MIKQQKKLEPEQSEHLFNTLEQRFQQHTERHMQISWAFVREQLLHSPEKLYALQQMEIIEVEHGYVGIVDLYFNDFMTSDRLTLQFNQRLNTI
jgi:predicted secreted Zn-dependent protease